jgi:PKHD-type hydroxylase
MISTYLTYKNSFDSIVDPVKNSWGEYWYLNSQETTPFCWNNQIFTDKEIDCIRVIGRRLGMKRAQTEKMGDCLDHRRSFTSWITPNQHTSWIYSKLTELVNSNNLKYFNFDLTKIETLQFTYYSNQEDGCYKAHVDPLNWNIPHNRKLSVVLQLSDPSEYEGGELRLYSSQEPIIIHKEKGYVVTFPSYTLHEVTPVTKGERYSLVAWVHGSPFK